MTRRGRTRASASVPPRTADAGRQGRVRGLALLLVALGAVPFLNSLSAPFVFDDHGSILENTTIQHLTTAFSGPIQSALAGRPVVNVSLALNYAMGGVDPWSYHAWNLAVHLLAGLALFGLVRRTLLLPKFCGRFETSAAPLAFIAALLWLVHPLQTEVVDYITQRTESMMGLCYLGTLYFALRASTEERSAGRWVAAAIAACAAGMACKESMVSAPLIALLFAAVFVDGSLAAALKRRPAFYAALASMWVVLLALNLGGPRAHSAGLSAGVSPWIYLQDQAVMLVQYLKLTVWPHGLVIDYGLPGPVPLARVIPGAILALALAVAVVAGWRRRPALAFLGLWVIVTLAPTTSIVPIATEVGAERRMYLPLAAIVVTVVIGVWRLLEAAGPRRGRVGLAAAAMVYLALAGLTATRNAEYHSPVVLWQAALDRYPNGGAHYGLAMALREAGRPDEAMREFQAAAPDYPEAEYALGVELAAAGQRAEAIDRFQAFVERRPMDFKVPATYRLMGEARRALGQYRRGRRRLSPGARDAAVQRRRPGRPGGCPLTGRPVRAGRGRVPAPARAGAGERGGAQQPGAGARRPGPRSRRRAGVSAGGRPAARRRAVREESGLRPGGQRPAVRRRRRVSPRASAGAARRGVVFVAGPRPGGAGEGERVTRRVPAGPGACPRRSADRRRDRAGDEAVGNQVNWEWGDGVMG